jgi:hypothetical protein
VTTDQFASLWTEASRDVERENALRAEALASAKLGAVWPFFALAQSKPELEHRKALARESLEEIAASTGLPLARIAEIIDQHFTLLAEARMSKQAEEEEGGQWEVVDKATDAKVAGPFDDREKAQEAIADNDSGLPSSELKIVPVNESEDEGEEKEASLRHQAIPEGENILAETVNDASGAFPASVEKLPEHDEGPDANIPPEAYSTVSMPQPGDSGASNPQSMAVKIDMSVAEARKIMQLALTGSRKTAVGEYVDPSQQQGQQAPMPDAPESATGMDTGMPPEGQPTPGQDPGGQVATDPYPMTTKPAQQPGAPGGGGDMGGDTEGDGGDPVSDQIDQVTSAIRRDNPGVSTSVARRVARQAVAKMLTAAGSDGIDYTHPTIPKAAPAGGEEDEDESLAGHAAETAGAGAALKVLPKVLPLLAL